MLNVEIKAGYIMKWFAWVFGTYLLSAVVFSVALVLIDELIRYSS